MPKNVKVKRSTSRLETWIANSIKEGLPLALSRANDANANTVVSCIESLSPKVWRNICRVCSRAVIRFGLDYPGSDNSENARKRLAFILAKNSVQAFRSAAQAERKAHIYSGPAGLAYSNLEKILFTDYRMYLVSLAESLITMLLRSQSRCADCRVALKGYKKCDKCKQPRCPVHCQCATGGKRASKSRVSGRRRS